MAERMSRTSCVKRIVESVGGVLSPKEAKQFLEETEALITQRARDLGIDRDIVLRDFIAQTKKEKTEEAILKTRQDLINARKSQEIDERLNAYRSQGLGWKSSWGAFLVGTARNIKSGRYSVAANKRALEEQLVHQLARQLSEQGLLPIFKNKALETDVARELWKLNISPHEIGDAPSGRIPEAAKVAKVLHDNLEYIRLRLNRAGANISKIEGYIGTQSHDMGKIMKAGYDKWRAYMWDSLDHAKTFGELDDVEKEKFLRGSYDALVTGIHLTSKTVESATSSDPFFKFTGPGNKAKRLSQHRKLFFKSADVALDYEKTYGKGGFFDGIMQQVNLGAQNIALLEAFGTNPEAMFLKKLEESQRAGRRADAEEKKATKRLGTAVGVKKLFDQVSGKNNIVDYPTLAAIGVGARAWQSLSKLGGVAIMSLTDIPNTSLERQFQGDNILGSYVSTLNNLFKGRGSKERREIAYSLGFAGRSMLADISGRFSTEDTIPGRLGRSLRLFFKINGLTWLTDVNKIGVSTWMANNVASLRRYDFHKLPKDMQRSFNQYGITPDDWDKIRQSNVRMADGKQYITPDSLRDLDPELFGKGAEGLILRDQLETKLQNYFVDRVNHGVLEPGAYEQYLANWGTRKGTVEGELARTIMQFRAFPIAYITRIWGRALYGKGEPDISAIVQLLVATTLFGYVSGTLADLFKGLSPRPIADSRTAIAAFTRGGGGGILSDIVLGEYSYGKSLTQWATGPTGGTLADIGNVVSAAKQGDKDAIPMAVRAVKSNTPFINLFYTRAAIDYLFFYELQEAMNPGYLARMERNVKKNTGREFIVPPSQTVK